MKQQPLDKSPPTSSQVHIPAQGIMFMVFGIGALTAMDGFVKALVQQGISPLQILGLRLFIIVPAILSYYGFTGQLRNLIPVRPKFQLIRGCIGFCAPFCFFLSLKFLPLSDAVITSYSSIMMISILSHFILEEKIGLHRWGAVVVGFIGVYVAVSPSGEGQILGYILVFIAALAYAIMFVSGRILSRTDSVGSMVVVFNLCTGLTGLCFMPFVWQPLNLSMLLMIIALSFLGLIGHFCVTLAFSRSQTSLVAPFEYTSLIWAVIIEWVVWQYLPEQRTVVGGLIIICAGLYVIYRENLRQRSTLQSCKPQ